MGSGLIYQTYSSPLMGEDEGGGEGNILKDRGRNFEVFLLCLSFPILSCFLGQGGIHIGGYLVKLPGCGLRTLTGIPCPFCGMTRAFCEVSNSHIKEAIAIQPGGVLIYFLCVISGLFFFSRGLLGKPFVDLRRGRYWTRAFNILLAMIVIVWICRIMWSIL